MIAKSNKNNIVIIGNSGILVKKPITVVNNCKTVLRKLLNNKGLDFENISLARGEQEFNLTGAGATKAYARNTYSVISFLEHQDEIFWLGLSLKFASEILEYRLCSLSILLFEGAAYDNKKTPLFRGEWHCPVYMKSTDHAQPHWHIYSQNYLELYKEKFQDEPQITEFRVFGEKGEAPISSNGINNVDEWKKNFHFAMFNNWHSGDFKAHLENFNIDELILWLQGCIIYIKNELLFSLKLK